MSIFISNRNFKFKDPVGVRGGNNPGASFEPYNAYRIFCLGVFIMGKKSSVGTIEVRHGGEGTMVVVYDSSLTRKSAFGIFMALSELFSNEDAEQTKFFTTTCVSTGCKIDIKLFLEKERSDYCTQNHGDCKTCSLVNYGLDCQNNPID